MEGLLNVRSGDGAGVLPQGFFQGALGQMVEESGQAVGRLEEEVQGRGGKGIGVDAGLLETSFDIAGEFVRGPGLERQAEAQARQQGSVDSHLETGQELFVPDQ